jgi:hypothetical protein
MPGVPRELIEHSLNVDPKATPKRQHLRRFADDRRDTIKKELAKLLAAGFIKEVFHPEWLAHDHVLRVEECRHYIPMSYPGLLQEATQQERRSLCG